MRCTKTKQNLSNRVLEDMQDLGGVESVIDPDGNCTQQLFNMFMTGKATPYLHNGTMNIQQEGEEKMSVER